MISDGGLISFFCMWLSNVPNNIYWRECSWHLWEKNVPAINVWIYFWFAYSVAFISLCVLYANIVLFWLLGQCSVFWGLIVWCHQPWCFYSTLPWLQGILFNTHRLCLFYSFSVQNSIFILIEMILKSVFTNLE